MVKAGLKTHRVTRQTHTKTERRLVWYSVKYGIRIFGIHIPTVKKKKAR